MPNYTKYDIAKKCAANSLSNNYFTYPTKSCKLIDVFAFIDSIINIRAHCMHIVPQTTTSTNFKPAK